MKKFLINWETDYCDDFPEYSGQAVIEAKTKEEAIKKLKIRRGYIVFVEELAENK